MTARNLVELALLSAIGAVWIALELHGRGLL